MTVRVVAECQDHDTVEVPGSSPVVPTPQALVRSNPTGASSRRVVMIGLPHSSRGSNQVISMGLPSGSGLVEGS